MKPTTPAPNPGGSPVSLDRRKVAGGKASRDTVHRLLGLDKAPERCVVEAVAWVGNHVEVAVLAAGQSVTLFLERHADKDEAYLTTEQLALWYQGAALPAALEAALTQTAPERLAGLGLSDLATVLQGDPELGSVGLPMPSPDDYDSPTPGHLHSWGATEVYADFFANAEVVRHQLDSLDLFMRCTCVQHSDQECMCVAPVHGAPIVSLVSFPWGDRHRRYDHRGEPEPFGSERRAVSAEAMRTTDLKERDVILGNPDKISAVLEQAVSNPTGGLILFSNTCVPVVTGEDVASVVKHYRTRSPVPLLYLTVSSQSMRGVLSEVLVRTRLAAEARADPPNPHAVNLIGFARDHATAELCELLKSAGIRVNEVIVPSVDPAAIERLPRAALNVYWPNALWRNLYDQLQQGSRIASIAPPAPFGQLGTRRWLCAVGDAVGRRRQAEEAWQRRTVAQQPRWSALTRRAAGRRLCFVARSSQIDLLTDPARSWGVPLLTFVEELGFAVDVLLHVRGPHDARQAAQAVQRSFAHPGDHTILAFDSPDRMMERLTNSTARAVFTQHFFDWRVTSAGKMPFSLMHLEHGLEGALLTLERLLGLCQSPFFRRFQSFLGRTPDGRRVRPPSRRDLPRWTQRPGDRP